MIYRLSSMAIGNRKRLEILLIVSIIVNCSIVCLQLFYKNEQEVKSRIEISRTVNRFDHGEFMHHVRVNENNNGEDGKEAQAKPVERLQGKDDKTYDLHVQEETKKGESLKDGNRFDSFDERRCPEGGEALGMTHFYLVCSYRMCHFLGCLFQAEKKCWGIIFGKITRSHEFWGVVILEK